VAFVNFNYKEENPAERFYRYQQRSYCRWLFHTCYDRCTQVARYENLATDINSSSQRICTIDTAVTVLVKEKAPEDPPTPPIGKKKKKVFDFVGTSADSRRLVLLSSSEDFEDTFAMKRNILTKYLLSIARIVI